ncbi:TatD family hydrolase [Candidatus Neomarinimicrobiota bacterium]
MLIDTHAHIFYKDYVGEYDLLLERAAIAGVESIICVGLDVETSMQAIALAEKYDQVWATVGVHPHDAQDAPENYITRLKEMVPHPKVVAIGEMGLDYFRNISPRDTQQRVFREQLELAAESGLPAVVHNREGDGDVYRILTEIGHTRGVLHCFSSTPDFARQLINFGLYISFTGTVTFGRNENAAVLEAVGLDRVMVETDCPYLAPVPHRGKTNEPAFVRHTADKIAEICGITLGELGGRTTTNAQNLFSRLNGT